MFKEFFSKNFNAETRELANQYLVDKALGKKAVTGLDKVVEITAMDFESTFNKSFIPSMIYTFEYNSKSTETIGKAKFIDYVPMILCCTNKGDYITGINFNFIPNDVRAELLEKIYNAYKEFYTKKLSDAVKKGSAIVNEDLAKMLIDDDSREILLGVLSAVTKYPIDKAYRKYDKRKISNSRMIEFDMWKYIPLLTFNDAVRGAGLTEIQEEIIANK